MAQRRMFSKKIVETDFFMEMSPTAKLLYFYLNMSADDDGFVGNPKTIKLISGATDDDLKILIAKQFIIPFDSGVIVIKDWKIHNYIRNDRYNETQYLEEKKQLVITENGTYSKVGIPDDIPTVSTGKDRLGKDRLGKDRLGKDNILSSNLDDVKEILSYLNEKAGTGYRASSKKTQALVKARFAEGYNLDDFKKVIDNKAISWKGTEWEKYLRPETLFSPKFEGYLNEKPQSVTNAYTSDGTNDGWTKNKAWANK